MEGDGNGNSGVPQHGGEGIGLETLGPREGLEWARVGGLGRAGWVGGVGKLALEAAKRATEMARLCG